MWELWQYRKVLGDVLDSQAEDLDSVKVRLRVLLERGSNCRRPITAHLEDGIFEFRGSGETRVLFYFGASRQIVFVHAFQKKKGKVDRRDIEMAKRRRSEIQEASTDVHRFASKL